MEYGSNKKEHDVIPKWNDDCFMKGGGKGLGGATSDQACMKCVVSSNSTS